MILVINLDSKRDKMGNPRKLSAVYKYYLESESISLIEVIDRRYEDETELKLKYPKYRLIDSIDIPVREYNWFKHKGEKANANKNATKDSNNTD
ncbi:hypothetical protein SAMN05216225_101148 [Ornithinibacillus halophilus]|uniref:Uncharacterized protein n=1 Tax=Ornithinibacillus halophilus TaxID=930117 RepID=A0A1M5G363_9BACI|nr:hypothetical protein SAMN05216225_101148 [Ornithinibacillus halophilus]